MKNIVFIVAILTIIVGCKSPDIAVINTTDGNVIHPPYTDMRQVVVSVAGDGSTFTTITKVGQSFVLKTFDLSCKQVSEVPVPSFTDGYCGTTSYAISKDGKKFVYYKDESKNLYLLDIPSQKETLLWKDIANTWMEIPHLSWISDSKILVVLRDYPSSTRKTNEITVFDIYSFSKRTLFTPVEPSSFDYSLLPNASMLAFKDANKPHDIDGIIKILDLQTGTIYVTLGNGQQLISCPCWNPDGSELAFFEGSELKVWSRNSNQTRTLRKFNKGFICYHIVFGSNFIGYIGSEADASNKPLVMLNPKSGAELDAIKEKFNGRIYLLGNTDKIVSEIGY